jgi:hypothetical protein
MSQFPGEDEMEQLAMMMEVCDKPSGEVLKTSQRRKKFFNDDNITRAFYDYFMNIECDDFNFTNRPETEFYKNLQSSNVPIIAKFLEQELYENEKQTPIKEYKLLFGDFISFLQRGNYKIEFTDTKFGIQIKEYMGISKRRTKKDGIVYDINFIILKDFLISKKYIDYVEFLD